MRSHPKEAMPSYSAGKFLALFLGVGLLCAWSAQGAEPSKSYERKKVDPKDHWAFQPVKLPEVPGAGAEKPVHHVDAFIRAELAERELEFSQPANKRVLARRAAFDLTGLPPKPDLLDKFMKDSEPGAWARYLDSLLALPSYGERWGRHWLDVARYADTQGYQPGGRSTLYPYAYTYRDWVINALNRDLPYNEFIKLQIAADHYQRLGKAEPGDLAALGFITVGNRYLNRVPEIIDDRIDVVTRGFMGLTVSCARCHDHKSDPIPTTDYYGLYGVFGSSFEPEELPLIGETKNAALFKAFQAEKAKAEAKITNFRQNFYRDMRKPEVIGNYLAMVVKTSSMTAEQRRVEIVKSKQREKLVDAWAAAVNKHASNDKPHPFFRLWSVLNQAGAENFASSYERHVLPFVPAPAPEKPNAPGQPVAASKEKPGGPKPVPAPHRAAHAANPLDRIVVEALSRRGVKNMEDVARAYGEILAKAAAGGAEVEKWPEGIRRLVAEVLPTSVAEPQMDRFYNRKDRETVSKLKADVKRVEASHAGAPPRAMVVFDTDKPRDYRVFIRGDARNQGDIAPRQFLSVLGGKRFVEGSGRLQLAEEIANEDNPLTARVMVNRVWMHHFGTGLVDTPSDFGVQVEEPVHSELLDYLAFRFVKSGWSLKALHKLIMTSATYRQSGEVKPANMEVDPDNRLFWRMPRRKLDFEAMRDSMLHASGELKPNMGGRPFEITDNGSGAFRRTVYAKVDRQALPPVFSAFDFANPDAHSPARVETMVPQKALYLLNGEFAVARSRSLVKLPEVSGAASPEEKVKYLYQRLYGRDPKQAEIDAALAFVKPEPKADQPKVAEWKSDWAYGYANMPQTAFEGDGAGHRIELQKLKHHSADRWQVGAKFPDDKLGYIYWSRAGGHPGQGDLAAVMRWTAPEDAEVRIVGGLKRKDKNGNGVRASIWKNGVERLKMVTVKPASAAGAGLARVALKKGDTLDFVVDALGDHGWDSFEWSPVVRKVVRGQDGKIVPDAEGEIVASAAKDFSTPPPPAPSSSLNRWEQLAHVLLISNEFAFVD